MNQKEHQELNRWIAEKVMGWKRFKYALQDSQVGFFQYSHGGIEVRLESGKMLFQFSPTTDPAAAMMVLEKCIEHVEKEFGSVDLDGQGGKFEICAMMRGEYAADVENDVEAETLPLAICLFARKLFSK